MARSNVAIKYPFENDYAVPTSSHPAEVINLNHFNVQVRDLNRKTRYEIVMEGLKNDKSLEELAAMFEITYQGLYYWMSYNGVVDTKVYKAWKKRRQEARRKIHVQSTKRKVTNNKQARELCGIVTLKCRKYSDTYQKRLYKRLRKLTDEANEVRQEIIEAITEIIKGKGFFTVADIVNNSDLQELYRYHRNLKRQHERLSEEYREAFD